MQLQCSHREKYSGESLVCCHLVSDEGAGKASSCQGSSVSWLQPTEEQLHSLAQMKAIIKEWQSWRQTALGCLFCCGTLGDFPPFPKGKMLFSGK